jgi:predicted dienelactone hydrolase
MRYFLLILGLISMAACSTAPDGTDSPTALPPTIAPTETAVTPQVEVVEDLIYAKGVDPDAEVQYLDITYLAGSAEPKPIVIWAHGFNGNKSNGNFLARDLAENGFMVATIDWNDSIDGMNSTAAKAYRGEGEVGPTIS